MEETSVGGQDIAVEPMMNELRFTQTIRGFQILNRCFRLAAIYASEFSSHNEASDTRNPSQE